jgi:two-component sensor histidine kinase
VYLSTLTEQIVNSYNSTKAITLTVHAKGMTIDLARATPAGLIINELVTNSLKYAFPASFDCEKIRGTPCTIEVVLSREYDTCTLTVKDNGIGLPAGFDITTTKTLGLKLANFLARHQMRAEIAVDTKNGTAFVFRFNDPAK